MNTPEGLQRCLAAMATTDDVALDTEFHPERSYFPRLMLVQLRPREGEAWLVDPVPGLDLRPLGAALSARRLIAHGATADLQILARVANLRPGRVFDTQVAAGLLGYGYPTRLGIVLREIIGRDIAKHETMSDWSTRPLHPDQLRYAAEDVLWLHAAADRLQARVDEGGKGEILRGLMDEQLAQILADPEDQAVWRSMPAALALEPHERAPAQALAAWRERVARERDQPRQNVLADAAILDLARRSPTTLEGIGNNRRLSPALIRRDGPAILAVLAAAAAAPAPDAAPYRDRLWTDLVRLAARVAERQTGAAAELTLGGDTVSRLARGQPLEPWRQEALGEWFFGFLAGNSSITIRDARMT